MKLKVLVCCCLIAYIAVFIPSAHAQTFGVIHTFANGPDGYSPLAGLTLKGGNLYGTTSAGPLDFGYGTVYQIRHVGSNWITENVYLFKSHGDGAIPVAPVVFGPDGRLYGTTQYGGVNDQGTVFRLTPRSEICRTANCFWNEEIVYSFNGADGAGGTYGNLTWDELGNIYGTTLAAGLDQGYHGNVYQLTPSGNGWNLNTLHFFSPSNGDGYAPGGGVIFDKDGNLWGTTAGGGVSGQGTIFEVKNIPGVGWQESLVYSFAGDTDGWLPAAGLVEDGAGNFYGGTQSGGAEGGGTVFELSPVGNSWNFQVLHSFSGAPGTYCGPSAVLSLDSVGNLYGTTLCDGAQQQGNVFKLTNTANGWVYTSVYDFTGGSDGARPVSNVTIDTDGTLYGTATQGGSLAGGCVYNSGCGTVWMIKP
jgi:uncharacterized repeat protein (TIGR03803 family)